MKKITIITEEWLAPDLALRLKNEGNDVYLAAKIKSDVLKGTIKRIPYAERFDYARDSDLVIFEDKSNGEAAMLREEGLSVIGGGKLTDKLEMDRQWASEIAKACGIKVPEMIKVSSLDEIESIIKERGGRWVMKQQGKIDGIKGLNFVAKFDDSRDLLSYIPILKEKWIEGVPQDFVIQEFIAGHEFAIGSYWNGIEFMKDADGDELCEENWEHKSLFPGNLGESTGEQYTVFHYVKAKNSKLFKETLDKCRDILKKVDFRGDFDINCKVTAKGAYFLEFTPRLGVPITSGQIEVHKSSWYDFLKAMADGTQDPKFKYDDRWTIVSWLYTKPFPMVTSDKVSKIYENQEAPKGYAEISELMSHRLSDSMGITVHFTDDFKQKDLTHIHMDGVMFDKGILKIGNPDGFVVTISEQGDTVEEAGENVENLLKKVIIPKAFWRNDFSSSNYHKSKDDLEEWGYLPLDKKLIQESIDTKLQKRVDRKLQERVYIQEQERKKMRDEIKKRLFKK